MNATISTARQKLESIIETGIQSAEATIADISGRMVVDKIVKTPQTRLILGANNTWNLETPDVVNVLHPHAFSQVIESAGLPKRFVDELEKQANGGPWGRELVAHNVNTVFEHAKSKRNLVRTEAHAVKGWLSDKFRRIDSRPLLDAFVSAARPIGLVPVQGVTTDTKVRLRAILPQVFEPVPNEVVAFGLEWGNSDYGDGGNVLSLFTMRIWCANLAVADSILRQVHLGKRLEDQIEYSQKTYELDTKANASALGDLVKNALGPAKIEAMVDAMKAANAEEIGRDAAFGRLKKYLDKGDAEKALAAYESPDVVNLPPGNSTWRLSNAVSWLAHAKDVSASKRLELERVAGELLPAIANTPAISV